MTTIAGVCLNLLRYERRRVDGCWMIDGDVTRVIERLLSWSYEDRVANACIGIERADLVLAGCAILEAIRSRDSDAAAAAMRTHMRNARDSSILLAVPTSGIEEIDGDWRTALAQRWT